MVLGSVVAAAAVRRRRTRSAGTSRSGTSRSASSAWSPARAGGRAGAGRRQFDAVYMPFTTVHRLLNLTKLNDITITAASTGEVSRIMSDVTKLLRERHGIGDEQAGRLHRHDAGAQALAKAACARTSRARSPATSRSWRR